VWEVKIKATSTGIYRGKPFIIGLTNQPTSRNKILHENPTVTQLVIKFVTVYRTWRFINVFTRTRHWIISWARWIQSTPKHPISFRFTLIYSCLQSGLFASGFRIKILYAFFISLLFDHLILSCVLHEPSNQSCYRTKQWSIKRLISPFIPLPYERLADYTKLRCREEFVARLTNRARMSEWDTPPKTLISTETDRLVRPLQPRLRWLLDVLLHLHGLHYYHKRFTGF
jgi:hypothetical protein